MTWFLTALLLVLSYRVVVGLRHARRTLRASREQRERFDRDNLEQLLRQLLVSGLDGGWMMLEDRSSGLRVQYKKYVRSEGRIGLEQVFPRASWAEPYYSDFQNLLRDRQIDFSRVVVQEENAPPEYTSVDFRTDVTLAADVAYQVFVNLFRIREPRLKIECDGIGLSRELVTYGGVPTFTQQLRELRNLLRNAGKTL